MSIKDSFNIILHRFHNKSCYALGSNLCEHIAISL